MQRSRGARAFLAGALVALLLVLAAGPLLHGHAGSSVDHAGGCAQCEAAEMAVLVPPAVELALAPGCAPASQPIQRERLSPGGPLSRPHARGPPRA